MSVISRRTRRPDSLAAAVVGVLERLQSPVPTDAMRIILNDGGRPVSAEHLGRLAAYERHDWLRTLLPPRLCSVIDSEANAIKPRWWALGDWRLQRRIMTEDVKPSWFAALAVALCFDLAEREGPVGAPIVTLALACVARAIEGRHFDLPISPDEWRTLGQTVYGPYYGALSNRGGATAQQQQAEASLIAAHLPAVDLYFGRESG